MISFVSVFLLLWLCWLLLVVCPDLSGRIAERRGRSIRLWWWMAIIFGPIAPLVVALLPPANQPGSRPPGSALGGLWRRTHGRASGERSAGDSRIIMVCATP
jgi:hypothetical protein